VNLSALPLPLQTFGLLVLSNLFMTVAALDQPLKWTCLWASLCPLGAVYFIFRT